MPLPPNQKDPVQTYSRRRMLSLEGKRSPLLDIATVTIREPISTDSRPSCVLPTRSESSGGILSMDLFGEFIFSTRNAPLQICSQTRVLSTSAKSTRACLALLFRQLVCRTNVRVNMRSREEARTPTVCISVLNVNVLCSVRVCLQTFQCRDVLSGH